MKNTLKNISLAVLLLGAVPALSAATFDFVAYTDNDSDNDGHHEWGYDKDAGFSVTEDGIGLDVTATALTTVTVSKKSKGKKGKKGKKEATKAPTWEAAHVYLDGGNAGLGVCKVLDSGSQCNPSNDDNVTSNEALKLAFDREVTISEITFTNGEHGTEFDGNFWLSVDGGTWQEKALTNLFTEVLVGSIFEFKNLEVSKKFKQCFSGGDYKTEFYIGSMNVSAVPVPAAAFLFAPALLGFMGLRRKAKKSVA